MQDNNSFFIGPYQLPNPWILAPMAGVSEMPFRTIALEMGAALAPTELISAKGLMYQNERTQRYLRKSPKERPFSVQLFGGEPDAMAIAAEIACAHGADMIDINMGCPVKKVTKTGAGSALLCDPLRAAHMVEAIKKKVSVPVTCKIRAGWDLQSLNYIEMGQTLESAGASAIALHARTRAQGYSGHADWSYIRGLKNALKYARVIGNGDVKSVEDAHRMQQETGCDFVMIGRAALGNPWIFMQLTKQDPYLMPSPQARCVLILRHLQDQIEFILDETRAIRQMREQLIWYSRGLKNAKHFREKIIRIDTLSEARLCIEDFFMHASVEHVNVLDEDDVNYQIALG